ncbi:hypothetical protein NKI31_00005 [Mesorhizobium sp. M0659]
MNPHWYVAWRDEAVEQLDAKNARLQQAFRLGSWPRYDYDLTEGKLLFSDNGITKVVAESKSPDRRVPRPATGSGLGQIQTCLANCLPTQSWFGHSDRSIPLMSWLNPMR